jgi:hypothetical protein
MEDSTRSCRAIRPRLAPTAARTASSRARATRQEQVGDIAAGQQQHDPDGCDYDHDCRPGLLASESPHFDGPGANGRVGGGMIHRQPLHDGLQLRRGLRQGHVVPHPRDDGGTAAGAPVGHGGGIDHPRNPEFTLEVEDRELELRWHYPHDLVGHAVQHDSTSDDGGVGAETAAPEPIAEDGDETVTRLRVGRDQRAPQ